MINKSYRKIELSKQNQNLYSAYAYDHFGMTKKIL